MTKRSIGKEPPLQGLRVGIDIGGTFTDFVVFDPADGSVRTFKLLTTPHDPSQAVLEGLTAIRSDSPERPAPSVIHGSTVATNALLERKGAVIGLVVTRGFGDVLEIGRQNRPSLYDFFAEKPAPLVPPELRFEVTERTDKDGNVVTPLEVAEVEPIISALRAYGAASVAVSFLFSFARPEHERVVVEKLRQAGFMISPSHEILPEYREYERTSTTAVNAYVSPVLENYLRHLEQGAGASAAWRVMQSNGGHIGLDEARRNGVRCVLSGPAGGVVGACYVARLAQRLPRPARGAPAPQQSAALHAAGPKRIGVITFDMGGTSTDVSLVDEAPQVTTESIVGSCPIGIPILDIHTIGAGGGSIARVDLGGALRVGPESAAADPGPACYGRGELPTVTDANLVLGRLVPEEFLGGKMRLSAQRAFDALSRLGGPLRLDAVRAALGVVEIVNAHMERALRVISVERGHDPRDYSLLSFGGAGGLHASALARRLAIPTVIIPPLASTLSAFGMLAAAIVKDFTQTVMLPGNAPLQAVMLAVQPLAARGWNELRADGVAPQDILVERLLDMRYAGQSYELSVPLPPGDLAGFDLRAAFHRVHEKAYGYTRPKAALEIVNAHVRATGKVPSPTLAPAPLQSADASHALIGIRPVVLAAASNGAALKKDIPFYRYESLRPGNRLDGPAIVVRSDTTLLLEPGDRATVDAYENLIVTCGQPDPGVA